MIPAPSVSLSAPEPPPVVLIPIFEARVPAGFPSPADGYQHRRIDLNEWLLTNPATTFLFQAEGWSMVGADIHDGDWLLVDRSREPQDKSIVVAAVDGQLTVKTLRKIKDRVWLHPENPEFPDIEITEERDCHIWGVIKTGIRVFKH